MAKWNIIYDKNKTLDSFSKFITCKWHCQMDQPYNVHQDHMVKGHKDQVFQYISGYHKHIQIDNLDPQHTQVRIR